MLYLFIFGCAGFSLAACSFSLVAESRGYSVVELCGLFTVVAFLVVEHGLQGTQASVAAVPRL